MPVDHCRVGSAAGAGPVYQETPRGASTEKEALG
jgi:hypothetical protein